MTSHSRKDLRLIVALAVLVLLVIVGVLWMLLSLDGGDRPPRGTADAAPPAPVQDPPARPSITDTPPNPVQDPVVVEPPAPTPSDQPKHQPPGESPAYDLKLEGRTKFQKRLSLGRAMTEAVEKVRKGEADALQVATSIRVALDRLLVVDNFTIDRRAGKAYGDRDLVRQIGRILDRQIEAKTSSHSALSAALLPLLEPPRDQGAFELTVVEDEADPMGPKNFIRMWGYGSSVSKEVIATADRTIRQVLKAIDATAEDGFDVLATPALGVEIFGALNPTAHAAGLYLIPDEFSIIRSTLSPEWLPEVIEHELVHAITFPLGRLKGTQFESSRFISEGLAEYLRRIEPADRGLHIPPGRFKDEFALLYQIVVARELEGWDFKGVDIAKFLSLSPEEFYQYGVFGYLVAQAAVAWAEPRCLAEALREDRSDRAIVRELRRLQWPTLMAFVSRYMVGGDPKRARVVEDSMVNEKGLSDVFETLTNRSRRPENPNRDLGELLGSVGIRATADASGGDPASVRTFFGGGTLEVGTTAGEVMEVLLSLRTATQVVVWLENDMTLYERFEFAQREAAPLAGLLPVNLHANTRHVFVEKLVDELARVRGPDGRRTTVAATAGFSDPEPITIPFTPRENDFSLRGPTHSLIREDRKPSHLVIMLGSKDGELRRQGPLMIEKHLNLRQVRTWRNFTAAQKAEVVNDSASLLFSDWLAQAELAPVTVLVVDLAGTGEASANSDAMAIAQAFALVMPVGARLAYWNPQVALKDAKDE